MNKWFAFFALVLAASLARADLNVDINTPVTVIVKHSMQQRTSRLVRFYDAGLIGLGNNGDIVLLNNSLKLAPRQIAEKLIDAETGDRNALVAAVAHGNGKREASDLPAVRAALVKVWRERWKAGWFMQDDQGNWSKKP